MLHRHKPDVPAAPSSCCAVWVTLPQGRQLPDEYGWPTRSYRRHRGRGGAELCDLVDDHVLPATSA